jgi:biopolymer transport protein ExbD/biopolymer transport protein TolR
MSFSNNNRQSRQNFSEINITPLTDVFLVLLVVMFLIAPLLDNNNTMTINPPASTSKKNSSISKKENFIFIEVDKQGKIAIDGKTVNISDEKNIHKIVYKQIEAKSRSKNKPKVKLKADDKSKYGRIVSIYDAVAIAKSKGLISQLVLITTVRDH